MNKESFEGYRTIIIMVLVIILTAGIMIISYINGKVEYLDRALIFFSVMSVFILTRNLIKSIKIDNKQFGIQVDAGVNEKEPVKDEVKE